MDKKINYRYVVSEYESDNARINDIYNLVFPSSLDAFESILDFYKIAEFLITNYLYFDDYLHSNNLMQWFLRICTSKKMDIPIWYKYFSIKIYSKRTIKFYLDNPNKFWATIEEILKSPEDFTQRIDSLTVDVLDFYKHQYVLYPDFLRPSINKFVKFYEMRKPFSECITEHVKELKLLALYTDEDKIQEVFKKLSSQTIGEQIDLLEESHISEQDKVKAEEKIAEVEENYYGDVHLDDEDSRKKIIIIGADEFVRNSSLVYKTAKTYNISKDQLEILNDYDKIKQQGNNIIVRTRYSDKYIGIIFGSNPHSTTGNEGASSLISLCTTQDGFPPVVVCKKNDSARPKITKGTFKEALRQLIIKYKSK